MTQKRPYHEKTNVVDIIRTIADGEKPYFPDELLSPSTELLREVCDNCWLTNPEERWTMVDIVQFLSEDISSEDPQPQTVVQKGTFRLLGFKFLEISWTHSKESFNT